MKRLFTVLLLAALLAGCSAADKPADVAATTLPVYDFTLSLCRDTDITVTRLVTEEVSCLHDYTLQAAQMRAIEGAKLVVISGAGLEEFLEEALASAGAVTDASEGIELICPNDHAHHDDHGHHHEQDSHIWLSPENGKRMAQNIAKGLIRQFPHHRAAIEANLQELLARFDSLQAYGEEMLKDLSVRELVTFHDGFSYFAEAFDLTILKAVEEESGSEASAAELIELIAMVKEHRLPALFTEVNGSASAAQIVADETGIRLFPLDMGMSGEGYFEAMYHNIQTIKEACG